MSREETIDKRITAGKSLVLEQLAKIPIVQIACEKSNVGRTTFYRWKKEDKAFAKKVNEAVSSGVQMINDMAESQLLSSIKNGNMRGITYWLSHRHKAYSPKLNVTGALKTSSELSQEQKDMVSKAINLMFPKK